MGTHVLLESAKAAGIKRFIHVSTDEVYGEQRADQDAMNEEQGFHSHNLNIEHLILLFFTRYSKKNLTIYV